MPKSRALLLAGVSALAMLACVAEADAEMFPFTGRVQSFPVRSAANIRLTSSARAAAWALGTAADNPGGLGAEVSGDIFLTAGETLTLFVGGHGQQSGDSTFGGGGGGTYLAAGGAGFNGGGGAGVASGAAGDGGDGAGGTSGFGAKFPNSGGGFDGGGGPRVACREVRRA